MSHDNPTAQISALDDFNRARQKAVLEQIMSRITGKSSELLAFQQVIDALKTVSTAECGLEEIPLDGIVGSVGRYDDFSRTFLPRNPSDAQRWATVKLAVQHKGAAPPIQVYQVGEGYFVLDGNHRVSIARQEGKSHIYAYVTEVRTRVPFSVNDQPDALIIKAEYAAFLERTGLDRVRPDVDLMVSAPGQYALLEDVIDIHRYCTEVLEMCSLSNEVVLLRWYDEAYLPVAEAIREQDALRYFPGRTETDFYIWLMLHQVELRQKLGWEAEPADLVPLASQYQPLAGRKPARLYRRLLNIASHQ